MKRNKRGRKNKKKIILISIISLLILGSGLLIYNKMFNNEEPKKEIKKEVEKEEKKVKIVDLDSDSRNIAVMINNISTVWGYQSGIQDAYLVYEMITEGGITRMMAIFRDVNTERIASVRSSRHYFLDYALENDALYVHIGGSNRALSDIKSLSIADITADVATWDNNIPLSSEHRAYTSVDKIISYANKVGYKTTSNEKLLLDYSAEEIDLSKKEGVIPANEVIIPYSQSHTTKFVYDTESKMYLRYQNNQPHTDYVTKKQYTTKNIITYKVYNSSFDSYGRQDLDNIGTGEGYYISNGQAVPITWEKSSRGSKTIYKYKNGEELVVNDGNTFIQIQPSIQTLSIN